jgi:hypothetical protein
MPATATVLPTVKRPASAGAEEGGTVANQRLPADESVAVRPAGPFSTASTRPEQRTSRPSWLPG